MLEAPFEAALEGENDSGVPACCVDAKLDVDPLDVEPVFEIPILVEGVGIDPVLEADVGFDDRAWPLATYEEAKLEAELVLDAYTDAVIPV